MFVAIINGKSVGSTLLNHNNRPSREAVKTICGKINKKTLNNTTKIGIIKKNLSENVKIILKKCLDREG